MNIIKGWKIALAVLLLLFGLLITTLGIISIHLSGTTRNINSILQTSPQDMEILGQRIKETKGESAYNEWIKSRSETDAQNAGTVEQLNDLTSGLITTGIMLLIVGLIYIVFFVLLLIRPLPMLALGAGIYAMITLVPILMIPSNRGATIEVIFPILIFIVSIITFLTKKKLQIESVTAESNQNIT